jgi:glutathione synthase/RimK-type ligase-like ATP-grasp enzyme
VKAVADGLEGRGVAAMTVDTLEFPEEPAISLGHRLDAITIDGLEIGRPASVYLRDIYAHPLAFGVDVAEEMDHDWRRVLIAFREKAHMLFPVLGRWAEQGVPMYNPMPADWLLTKPMQITLLDRAGMPVPETIWTNDPEQVRRFAEGRRVAYKPVAGGAATRELGPEDLTEERLRALRGAPVTFQELLPGDNYRVYVIDGEVVATIRVVSESLDYRQQEESIEQTTLPDETLKQCIEATSLLGLRWSGIDLKADAAGTLKFLELNPSPMFLGFDRKAGTGILDALVAALASHV